MNSKLTLIIALGLLAMTTLFFIPPWKAHGEYVGHYRVDRVAWLDFDSTRFYIEEGAIAFATIALAIMLRNKK